MYLLYKEDNHQKREFGFQDFFPMEDISKSRTGLKIISTTQFLERLGVTGKLRDLQTGEVSFPPMVSFDYRKEKGKIENYDSHPLIE